VFAGVSDEGWGVSLKLPESADFALSMPCCKPTGYGLGKAGWVSVKVRADEVPMDMMLDWLDESYRAVAPKTLVKKLPSGPATQS
jgi:predicted DNA-binding protein (MmcQ/YjbR family)